MLSDKEPEEEFPELNFYRACGDVICKDCGQEYRKHSDAKEYLSFMGTSYLRRLCNGDLVKL